MHVKLFQYSMREAKKKLFKRRRRAKLEIKEKSNKLKKIHENNMNIFDSL